MLAAGGLLLAAVANVSGMLLARSSAGSREIAIRLALGAQPANLIRQFATEGLMLGGAGAIAGVAISVVALRWLNEIQPPVDVPLALDLSLSPPVLSLACSVALVVAVVFMVIPTREASRTDVMNVLRNGSQTASRADTRLRIRFVTLQVIFTVVLLTVAGAFAGAVRKGINTDAGIATDNVVVAGMNLETSAPSAEAGHALQERLLSRIRAVAYVDAAALTTLVPLGHTTSRTGVSRGEGGSSASIAVSMSWVSSEYFQVLKIPLVRGREFQDADRNGLPLVAIINETLAGQLWGREDPVGQPLRFGGESYEVIGIARNGKYNSISEAPQPFAYFALAQEYASEVSLVTRLKASPDAALSALPRLIRDVDPGIPVADVRTMDAHVALNVLPQRIIALLTAALGIVGLLLASIGLYGTVSYTSATRTREFGIRMALGETSQSVLTDVVKGSISIVVKGLAIGSCLAAGAMLLLRRFVFGIGPLEVLVVAVAACVVLIAAMVASYVPARRATRVDPVIALRAE
jgi:predicted permease